MSEEKEFKVIDKRRYSSDGEPVEAKASNISGHSEDVKPESNSSESKAADSNTPKPSSSNEASSSQETSSENRGSNSGVDFASFAMSLAHQTLVLLGEAPNPETQLINKNLPAAKQTIDILELLEEKTRGNLSKDEDVLLKEILTSLRMAFVQSSSK